jgi:hypothetical protein
MSAISIEPPRYGMTGLGVGSHRLTIDTPLDMAVGYALDAPEYIARGSMLGRADDHGRTYISATDLRPGVLA